MENVARLYKQLRKSVHQEGTRKTDNEVDEAIFDFLKEVEYEGRELGKS